MRKHEFLATLAHELRNPLAPIRTGLELIRLGGDTAVAVERVRGIMERQVGHMVRLIDDASVLWQLDAQFDLFGSHGGTIGFHGAVDQTARAVWVRRWSAILPDVILDTSRRSSIKRTM